MAKSILGIHKRKIVCSVVFFVVLVIGVSPEWSFSSTILVKLSVKMCRMSVLEGRDYLVKWGLSLLPNGGLTTKTEKLYAFLVEREGVEGASLKTSTMQGIAGRI